MAIPFVIIRWRQYIVWEALRFKEYGYAADAPTRPNPEESAYFE